MINPPETREIEAQLQTAETYYYEEGRFEDAYNIYRDLLSQLLPQTKANQTQMIPTIIIIFERLADLSVIFGENQAADGFLAAMKELNEQEGDRYGANYAQVKRIHVNLMAGHLREAYNLLETMSASIGNIHEIEFSAKGLDKWEKSLTWTGKESEDRTALMVRLYHVMGLILACLGQYKNSIAACKRGLYHCRQHSTEFVQYASMPLHLALAETHLEKGELSRAKNLLDEIHHKIDKATQPGDYVHSLNLTGKISLLRGNFGHALECFKEVFMFCRESPFNNAFVQAGLNLAHIMIFLNQVNFAEDILDRIIDYTQKTGDQASQQQAEFLKDLAYARSHSQVDENASPQPVSVMQKGENPDSFIKETKYIDSLDLPQADNYLAFFEDRALGFYWYLAHSSIEETRQYLDGMIEVFKHTDSRLIEVRLQMMTGLLAYYKNHFKEAEKILKETVPILENLGLKPDLLQVLRILRWCAARLKRSETEQVKRIMQTDDLLNEIADSLEGADRAIYLLNKWTVEEEKLKVEIDRIEKLEKKCAVSSWIYRPFLKCRLFKQLDTLLTSIDAKKDIDAHRILKEEEKEEKRKSNRFLPWHLLKPSFKKMTLSFLVLPDRVLITYRGWFRFGIRVIHMTRLKIRLEVQKWHRMMKHLKEIRDIHDDNEPEQDISTTNIIEMENKAKETAEEIAKQLQIPGILEKLPKGISLRIIPDDVLHGFPFAAIFYDGKYLVERYSLSIDFEQETGKNKIRGNKKSKALLVGVSAPVMGNPPLRGVPKELKMIEDWYKKSCREPPLTLSNHEANKKTVLQRLTQCKYFHIACHGTFKPEKPDQSGLLLVPAPNEMEMLSIRELSKLNLAGLEHVTLSSCWSADNFIAPGRIIISLPETLRRAGAESILGSLWPLHDSFAIAFMERFYDYLEKYPRDKALQKTQLDCINKKLSVNGKIKSEKPSHWAAFNLYGSAKRLSLF